MTYGSDDRPLLVDVWLKFETAEMHMIRIDGCVVSPRRTEEEVKN